MKIEFMSQADYPKYINSLPSDIDKHTEDMLFRILIEVFPYQCVMYDGLKFVEDGKSEMQLSDLAVVFNEFLLLFECKCRDIRNSMTADIQKVDYSKLESWIEKRCSQAKRQHDRAYNLIQRYEYIGFDGDDFQVLFNTKSFKKVLMFTVLHIPFDFGWLTKFNTQRIKYPEVDIFDIRFIYLLSRFCSSPKQFIRFIECRKELFVKHSDNFPYDETILQYYLYNDRSFEDLMNSTNRREFHKIMRGTVQHVPLETLYDEAKLRDIRAMSELSSFNKYKSKYEEGPKSDST